ncbi:hypothetical protein [Candidatus Thiosymbion oneisti]|uniref:hypothetical protein n=1 Tax=Candidatus Thiosymbion oneisti TaxID=589554 RepID=UPI0010610D11|nr:hypothetical protein [Candidatus Thiosymbion oneisti]
MARGIFALFACFLVLICWGNDHEIPYDQETDRTQNGMPEKKIVVGDFELTISRSDDKCIVHYKGEAKIGAIKTNMTSPCVFAVGRDGNVHSEKTKWGWSLILVSSEQSTNEGDCITRLQGILVGKGQVLSSPVQQTVALCGHGPWDQKSYLVFAAQTAHFHDL